MRNKSETYNGVMTVDRMRTSLGNVISQSSTSTALTSSTRALTSVVNGLGGSRPLPTPFSYTSTKTSYRRGSYVNNQSTNTFGYVYRPEYPHDVIGKVFLGTSHDNYRESGLVSSAHFSGSGQFMTFGTTALKAACHRAACEDLYSRLRGNLDVGSDFGEAGGFEGAGRKPSLPPPSGPWKNVASGANRGYGATQKFIDAVKATPWIDRYTPIGALKKGSKAWLAWNYSLKPAIYSIYDACEFVASEDGPRVIRGKAYLRDSRDVEERATGTLKGLFREATVKTEVWERITVRYRVSDPVLFDLNRITTFNPYLIAWNMMPCSFIFDWFVDVGGWMRNAEASLGMGLAIEHVETSVLTRQHWTNHLGGSAVTSSDGGTTVKSQDQSEWRIQTTFKRSVSPSLPYAPLSLPGDPGFKFPWQRMLSAGAFGAQGLPGRKR